MTDKIVGNEHVLESGAVVQYNGRQYLLPYNVHVFEVGIASGIEAENMGNCMKAPTLRVIKDDSGDIWYETYPNSFTWGDSLQDAQRKSQSHGTPQWHCANWTYDQLMTEYPYSQEIQ